MQIKRGAMDKKLALRKQNGKVNNDSKKNKSNLKYKYNKYKYT
jgi:hypothetical protein